MLAERAASLIPDTSSTAIGATRPRLRLPVRPEHSPAEHGGIEGHHHRAQPAEIAVAGELLDDRQHCGSFAAQTSTDAATTHDLTAAPTHSTAEALTHTRPERWADTASQSAASSTRTPPGGRRAAAGRAGVVRAGGLRPDGLPPHRHGREAGADRVPPGPLPGPRADR